MQVADVTPEVLAVLLRFIYTGEVGKLPRNLLSADAVGELFDAADRFLVFLLKVCLWIFLLFIASEGPPPGPALYDCLVITALHIVVY